jgi:hypothetical protein
VVAEVIRRLRADGQRITLRAVKGLVGGSYRDLTRLLKDAKEFLADDEVADLDTETPEPLPPPPGQLAIAKEAVDAAEIACGEVQNLLDAAQEKLRSLQRECPASTTDPHAVADVVAAQLAHDFDVLSAQREVEALQRILDGRQAERTALQADLARLRERAHYLKTTAVPALQRQMVDSRRELEVRERNAVHAIALARRQVEATERSLVATEAELAALVGQ